tara:strand:+ start:166 stop:312 length:147 start_codon:yes stop_codon:yes gene_type:complete
LRRGEEVADLKECCDILSHYFASEMQVSRFIRAQAVRCSEKFNSDMQI